MHPIITDLIILTALMQAVAELIRAVAALTRVRRTPRPVSQSTPGPMLQNGFNS